MCDGNGTGCRYNVVQVYHNIAYVAVVAGAAEKQGSKRTEHPVAGHKQRVKGVMSGDFEKITAL